MAVNRPAVSELFDATPGESSADVAVRVAAARRVAIARSGTLNAALDGPDLDAYAPLTQSASDMLMAEMERDLEAGKADWATWAAGRDARWAGELLKVAAVITRNTRRIRRYLASSWPSAAIFAHAMSQLRSP